MSTFSGYAATQNGRFTRRSILPTAPHHGALLDIVLVSTQSGWSPAEQSAQLLARELRERGHSVRVAAVEATAFAQRMESDAFEVQTLRGTRHLVDLFRMRRYLRMTSPDVVLFLDPGAMRLGSWITWHIGRVRRIAGPGAIVDQYRSSRFTRQLDAVLAHAGQIVPDEARAKDCGLSDAEPLVEQYLRVFRGRAPADGCAHEGRLRRAARSA